MATVPLKNIEIFADDREYGELTTDALQSEKRRVLRSQIISDVQTWDLHRPAIDALISTTALATAHSTTSWQRGWWDSLAGDASLQIGLWWDGTDLVGYAPLMTKPERLYRIPRRVLRFIGDGISDYADLCSKSDRPEIMARMVSDVLERFEWDELQLSNVRAGSPTIAAFQRNQTSRYLSRVRVAERCLHIDLQNRSFEEYYRSLSRNHRRELQKRRHKLDALGSWTIHFGLDASPETLFEEFRGLHTARSDAMGWTSLYDIDGFRELFLALMQPGRSSIEVLCSTLRHERKLMSYTLGFVYNSVYYHWNIGFDAAYEAIAPNKLHHQFLIEECFRRGYREFDFMRGAYEYKFKWTEAVRENYGIRFLKRRGWQRALNQLVWLQEREPGSLAARLIDAPRTTLRALRKAAPRQEQQEVSAS